VSVGGHGNLPRVAAIPAAVAAGKENKRKSYIYKIKHYLYEHKMLQFCRTSDL
jgi:hypothetical protein